MKSFARKLLTQWSPALTALFFVLGVIGFYLGSSIDLKLSLTDLLPDKHPAVVKLEKLTEVVGGVGYLTIVLRAEDGVSHLKVAPVLVEELKSNKDIRSVFYHREQRFFVDRLLYYLETDKLKDLDKSIDTQMTSLRRKAFDIGLWDEDEKKPEEEEKPVFADDVRKLAQKSASISQYLISADKKHLLVMVKPDFDSTDLAKTEALVNSTRAIVETKLPSNVTYEFAERYYNKIVETSMIKTDIFVLGGLSIVGIALIIFLYLKSFTGMLLIFIPVSFGMGITVGLAELVIGHINIVTGFLMGIVSGLGVDYGIHLLLRLRLEKHDPSSHDPDPVWRTLRSSGHSVFVGAVAAAFAFYLLCFSDFRAFSEFGFICGTGIVAVLVCHLACFSALSRMFALANNPGGNPQDWAKKSPLPVLSIPSGLTAGIAITLALIGMGMFVGFEYDFDKLMRHSKKMEDLAHLVDRIYDRNSAPSAFSAATKDEAVAVEKVFKDKYIPNTVSELVSGATIVPEDQETKQKILLSIKKKIAPLKNRWIEKALDVPGKVVRDWVDAKPFTFADLPPHVQDALRGTKQSGFLLYFYPAIKLNDARNVKTYANMIRHIEREFPNLLTGSDAVVFADILDLIARDGAVILIVIFFAVGLFVWANVRKPTDTLLSYLPLLISLPVGMGLMLIFGIKFNIFNISIIPTFVAMGIDVPIHIVHRARETGSGYRAARDLAASINLALLTAGVGFGVLIFARAGVLKSLGWISLLATAAIWWVGLFLLPAYLERYHKGEGHILASAGEADGEPAHS